MSTEKFPTSSSQPQQIPNTNTQIQLQEAQNQLEKMQFERTQDIYSLAVTLYEGLQNCVIEDPKLAPYKLTLESTADISGKVVNSRTIKISSEIELELNCTFVVKFQHGLGVEFKGSVVGYRAYPGDVAFLPLFTREFLYTRVFPDCTFRDIKAIKADLYTSPTRVQE